MLFKIHIPKKDAAEFRLDGFLCVDLYGTSVGVYQYTRPDGQIVNEYKSVDEVARPESLQTILGVPLTVHHPYEFADPNNFRTMLVGAFILPGTMDGRRVKTRAVIYDAKTIERVLNGELTEISMGYYHTPESVNGSFEGIEYQVLQTWIYYNHGSLYEPGGGRLGSEVGVSMDTGNKDAAGRIQQFVMNYPAAAKILQTQDSIREVQTMLVDLKNGKSVDIPDAAAKEVIAAIQYQDSKITTLNSELIKTKEDSATVEARLSALEQVGQQDAAQQQQDQIDAAVAERQEIMDSARSVLPANYEFKGKSNAQIMTDSLDVLQVELSESAKSVDSAIRAAFDTAIKYAPKPAQRTDGTPAQRVTQQIAQDAKAIGAGAAYVPLTKRTDGIADHSGNLEAMNKFFNKKGAKV